MDSMLDGLIAKTIDNIHVPHDLTADTFEDRIGRFRQRTGKDPHHGQLSLLKAIFEAKRGGPRVIIARTGKQAGKSITAGDAIADEFHQNPYAHIWAASGSYETSENIYNKGVKGMSPSMVVERKSNSTPRFRYFIGGGFIKSKSWKEVDALEMDECDAVVCDEAQTLDNERYKLLRPRVLARTGWLLLIGSPKEASPFFNELCDQAATDPSMVYITFKTSDNPAPEIQKNLISEKMILDEEEYEELYEGKPRKRGGLVFPQFDKGTHLRQCPFDKTQPVYLWIDPGARNYAVVPVQFEGRTVNVIDVVYLEATPSSAASDAKAIQESSAREWWPKVASDGVVDFAARQRRGETGSSTIDNWWEIAKIRLRSQLVPIDSGHRRLQDFLKDPVTGQPMIFFDIKCGPIFTEFANYHYNQGGGIVDSYNHALKSLAYGLVDRFGYVDRVVTQPKRQRNPLAAIWRGG